MAMHFLQISSLSSLSLSEVLFHCQVDVKTEFVMELATIGLLLHVSHIFCLLSNACTMLLYYNIINTTLLRIIIQLCV